MGVHISLLFSSVPFVPSNEAKAEVVTKTITIDGRNVNPYHRFKGFGTVTANNTTRLLLDYKEEHPEKYWDIMNQLFNKDTGAGLTHVKVELGADVLNYLREQNRRRCVTPMSPQMC